MDFHEFAERPVVGAFHLVGEAAGRQFIHAQVKGDALAALAFPRTGLVAAIAAAAIFFNIAVHGQLLL
jgi:hypothetical protein